MRIEVVAEGPKRENKCFVCFGCLLYRASVTLRVKTVIQSRGAVDPQSQLGVSDSVPDFGIGNSLSSDKRHRHKVSEIYLIWLARKKEY